MTHEFKTPIATISLAADSIKSPKIIENPTKIARFIGIIKQENKRMLDQVEKVLQMALLEKKEFKLKPEPLDINRLIENAVEHIGLQVIPKGGSVTTELDKNVKALYGDKTHLNNIIHNLLDNANKYSPENPTSRLHQNN
jgi:Osmosensitive K+ channel histidine kinase